VTVRPVVVIVRDRRASRSSAYASVAGDARRQGRADAKPASPAHPPVIIQFVESSASIEARLGVVTVGVVTHDLASGDYFWSVDLALMPRKAQRARTAEKAKEAVAHKVREWCEAARMISARRDGGAR
jgi:hypothetical protein